MYAAKERKTLVIETAHFFCLGCFYVHGILQKHRGQAVKNTVFAATVRKSKFRRTALCRRADHKKSCRHFRLGQQRSPQRPHSPSGEPSESPRHFAASMDESVIVGYYTLKKCLSVAPRCLQISKKGQKIYGKK